jgi:hypothetical protein
MPEPVDEPRSGAARKQRERGAQPILALCGWLVPHAVIWLAVGVYILAGVRGSQCSGSCGLVRGLIDYLVLAVAVTLSAAVGVIELVAQALLSRPSTAEQRSGSIGLPL